MKTEKVATSNASTPAPEATAPEAETATPNAQGPEEQLTPLDIAREDWVNHVGNGQGKLRAYSEQLTIAFGAGWALLSFGGRKLDEAEKQLRDRINAEKDKFLAACKARGIVNPHASWADVKKHAKGEKAKTGANANEAREMTQRQREELSKLYKAAMKDEDLSDTALTVNEAIGRILRDNLKVDLATLVK